MCSNASSLTDDQLWSRAPSVDFFPVEYTLPISGFRVSLRMLGAPDVDRYFETFQEAASIDEGFR